MRGSLRTGRTWGVGVLAVMGLAGALVSFAAARAGAGDASAPRGAWVQEDVKWAKAPHSVVPHAEAGDAQVLYFGKDQTFALIECVLNRTAKGRETISAGDGQAIYAGSWSSEGESVGVSYRLISRTVGKVGEALPGPMQQASIKKIGEGEMVMGERKFRRAKDLDEEAEEYARSGMGSL